MPQNKIKFTIDTPIFLETDFTGIISEWAKGKWKDLILIPLWMKEMCKDLKKVYRCFITNSILQELAIN